MRRSIKRREEIIQDMDKLRDIRDTLLKFAHKKGCKDFDECPKFCCRRVKKGTSKYLDFGTSIMWVLAKELSYSITVIEGYYLRSWSTKKQFRKSFGKIFHAAGLLCDAYENHIYLLPKAKEPIDSAWDILAKYSMGGC